MKNKSDLKRKVLCSLLAASTMGIFYSSDALAASVNGQNPDFDGNGVITDSDLGAVELAAIILLLGKEITLLLQLMAM